MRSLPDALDVGTVAVALRDGWGFDPEVVEYAPVGAGSYHWDVVDGDGRRGFVTVDDLDQKAWLGDIRDTVFDGVRRAFDTAAALRDAGLRFVVAPLSARSGESVHRLDARYSLALFPHVDGEAGEFGYFEDDAEGWSTVVAMLADLHAATRSAGAAVPALGFDLPAVGHLEAALRERDEPWSGGPLSEAAREAVQDAAADLAELLALAGRLRADALARCGDWVVTHGEPHAGNVMRTGDGARLVDWDTVALGPPERDLWRLVAGGGAEAAALYHRLTGTEPDPAALDFFRLTWDLKDLGEYLYVLRGPHEENDDTLRSYGALVAAATLRESWIRR
jgi:spectinomycin phosphotransferase